MAREVVSVRVGVVEVGVVLMVVMGMVRVRVSVG